MKGCRVFICVLLMAFGLTTNVAQAAVEPWEPSVAELRLLPPYCKVKMGKRKTKAEITHWTQLLGEDVYIHIHHYCAGLNFLNRANKTFSDKQKKAFNLKRATTNIQYMLNHAPANNILRPDFHLSMGRVYLAKGENAKVVTELTTAIRTKPDYIKPYLELIDYYMKVNQVDRAKQILADGLGQKPGSKALKRRQKKLNKM